MTIGPVVWKITCLRRIDTYDRHTETGDHIFRTLGVMKRRENRKLAIRPMDSIMRKVIKIYVDC